MPRMGKLPSFAVKSQHRCSWPALRDLPGDLELPPDSRVKSFRYEFSSDYRVKQGSTGATTVTFIYISGAGRGLQVLAV
jgi:hypothetical protein